MEVNPFEEYSDWFSSDVMPTPLRDAPEPKSRFVPSKWEAKKVVKLVRALRRGWLRRKEQDQVGAMAALGRVPLVRGAGGSWGSPARARGARR